MSTSLRARDTACSSPSQVLYLLIPIYVNKYSQGFSFQCLLLWIRLISKCYWLFKRRARFEEFCKKSLKSIDAFLWQFSFQVRREEDKKFLKFICVHAKSSLANGPRPAKVIRLKTPGLKYLEISFLNGRKFQPKVKQTGTFFRNRKISFGWTKTKTLKPKKQVPKKQPPNPGFFIFFSLR